MYTECPACSTAFRVTAKALQQASGRVRCGDCGVAFSALDYLTEDFPESGTHGVAAGDNADDAIHSAEELAESNRALLEKLDELAGPDDVRIEDTGIEWRVLNEITATDETGTNDDDSDAADDSSDEREAGDMDAEDADLDDAPVAMELDDDDVDDAPVATELDDDDVDDAPVATELDDDDPARPPDGQQQGSLELEDLAQTAADAWRFDDDTPHPESAVHDEAQPEVPQRRAEDLLDEADAQAVDDTQTDFLLSEPEDWSELLDEVRESGSENDVIPLEVEEELAAIHSELSARMGAVDSDDGFAAKAAPTDDDAGRLPGDGDEEIATDDDAEHLPDDGDEEIAAKAAAPAEDDAEDPGIDPDSAEALFQDESLEVETIIMEGDSIRRAIEEEPPPAEVLTVERFEPTDTLFDDETVFQPMRGGRRSTDPPSYGVIAGTVLLTLLLAGQVIHAYRETLSTYGLFDRTIGPVYRLLGNPVTPEWNIQGWQFEATNGSVAENDDVLTIISRIGNKSEIALPYPLVHVSLTDRWEEIIGSRVLAPDEYLAGDLDPSRPVIPGENFTAVITVDDPSVEATGFKLNVCYRVSPGRVRCATEDFKD